MERWQKEVTEQLLIAYRDVLAALRNPAGEGGKAVEGTFDDVLALKQAREVIERAGGFDTQLPEIEALAAHHGNNFTPLVERFFRPDRPTMYKLARRLTLVATSEDRSVLEALEHALAHQHLTRPLISDIPRWLAALGESGGDEGSEAKGAKAPGGAGSVVRVEELAQDRVCPG